MWDRQYPTPPEHLRVAEGQVGAGQERIVLTDRGADTWVLGHGETVLVFLQDPAAICNAVSVVVVHEDEIRWIEVFERCGVSLEIVSASREGAVRRLTHGQVVFGLEGPELERLGLCIVEIWLFGDGGEVGRGKEAGIVPCFSGRSLEAVSSVY